MSQIKIPNQEFQATGEQNINLTRLKGQNVVLYFYPKDSTPGCTTEGQNFKQHYADFLSHNTVVLGVSRDSIKSHENFKSKQQFPFELISDPEEILCNAFDVIKEKNMYGRKYMGIERSTFIIDKNGKVFREWRKVKVKNHVDEVLDVIKTLS